MTAASTSLPFFHEELLNKEFHVSPSKFFLLYVTNPDVTRATPNEENRALMITQPSSNAHTVQLIAAMYVMGIKRGCIIRTSTYVMYVCNRHTRSPKQGLGSLHLSQFQNDIKMLLKVLDFDCFFNFS